MWQPVYAPRTRAREYCPLAVGIYTGCPHRCTYCYVPAMLRIKPEAFHTDIRPRALHGVGIAEAVHRQLSKPKYYGKGFKVMLSFTCDPYPVGHDSIATREVIKAIKDSGNHVSILTKGDGMAQRDFDLLDHNDSFGVTLTGGWRELEPGSAWEITRERSLEAAHRAGIPTWVSCEPVFSPDVIMGAIKRISFVSLWRIGKLNHRKSRLDWAVFGHNVEALCKSLGQSYYIKEDLRRVMEG